MLTVCISKISTPIGELTAGVSDLGVHLLLFSDAGQICRQKDNLKKFSEITFSKSFHKSHEWLSSESEDYFSGKRRDFSIPVQPMGTDFQQRVWSRLKEIPFGKTESYEAITNSLGNPKAIRAVAAANGRNPIAILIPCHRVIGKNGNMTGYAGGLDRKRFLLNHERRLSGLDNYNKGVQMELL